MLQKYRKSDLMDVRAFDQTMSELVRSHKEDILTGPGRPALLALFQKALQEGGEILRERHLAGGSGRYVVRGRAYLIDLLLRRLYRLARISVTRGEHARKTTRKFSLVAIGGYGRGELSPYSDVDLLFLLPDGVHPEFGLQVERMLYFLWDLGLDVGHSVRTVDECVQEARRELQVGTSLLESRFLSGSRRFFNEYHAILFDRILHRDPVDFLRAKLEEQRQRHERFGNSIFYLEPNIKENPGGQRDIHTFFWIAKYRYRVRRVRELVEQGLITPEEYRTFTRCREFFWRVRNALHYRARRREDRLTFQHQLEIAAEFGYRDRPGMRGVEQFMRRYYQVATQVSHLSQIFLMKYQSELGQCTTSPRECTLLEDVYYLCGDKIVVLDREAFLQRPSRLMKLFEVAQRRGLEIHPESMRLVAQNLNLMGRELRRDPEVTAIFRSMLASDHAAAWVLRKMNVCGLLGRFLPEFGRIIGQTQHDLFHVFTVDEHSILAVEALRQIKNGVFSEELPIATQLMNHVRKPMILYLAVLFHDIAKGRGGVHEVKGAELARTICARIGMNEEETETICWLVRNHLIFSRTAFRRDINDPETVAHFARQVEERSRLDYLVLLTVADIRAVGPGVWNHWKANLLRRLYQNALEVLDRGEVFRPEELARMADTRRANVRELLVGKFDPREVDDFLTRFYPDFFMGEEEDVLAEYFQLLHGRLHSPLAIAYQLDTASGTTRLLLYTQDHPGLIAKSSGALAASGANILSANINTTKDGMALDIYVIQDGQGRAITAIERLERIEQNLTAVMQGKTRPEILLAQGPTMPRKQDSFQVPTSVEVDNESSALYTILEVTAMDQPGLLFTITRELGRHGVRIITAKIATYGERAVDVFNLKDVFGLKLNERKIRQISRGLQESIQRLSHKGADAQSSVTPRGS